MRRDILRLQRISFLVCCFLFVVVCRTATGEVLFDQYGGWTGVRGEATGYFHVQELNGRWWLITPEGNAFWSAGVYCVRMSGIPETGTGKRRYRDASLKKYGSEEQWADRTLAKLRDWGFNTIGDWSSASTYAGKIGSEQRLAYVIGIDLPRKAGNVIPEGYYGYFPDVFSDTYRESAEEAIAAWMRRQPRLKDDPWLLGYYLADEPSWYGSTQRRGSIVDDFIRLDFSKPGKKAWVDFVRSRYDTIEDINNSWETSFKDLVELSMATRLPDTGALTQDKLDFLEVIAETFGKTLHGVLRMHDSKHMILGTRPSRRYPEILKGLGKYCDVFSTSAYDLNKGYEISEHFDESVNDLYNHTGRPLMLAFIVTAEESDFDSGMVKTQRDRGISYWRYLARTASHPAVVGVHWFQYFDPPKKCYDEGASNWGLVNEYDDTYEEAVELIAQANDMVYAYAAGLASFVPDFGDTLAQGVPGKPEETQEEKNIITLPLANGDFEAGRASWRFQTWKGSARLELDTRVRHSGQSSLKVAGGREEGWESVGVALQDDVPFTLRPGYDYTLSAWIKTRGVVHSAFVRIKATNAGGQAVYFSTREVYGTEEWQLYETTFTPDAGMKLDLIVAQLIGRGDAWFDDIAIRVAADKGQTAEDFLSEKARLAVSRTVARSLLEGNMDFEAGEEGWSFQAWKGEPRIAIDTRTAHSGDNSAKITGSGSGWDSVGVVARSEPSVVLKADTMYRLTGWIKAHRVENTAFLKIKVTYPGGKAVYFESPFAAGTTAWQEAVLDFSPQDDCTIDYFTCQLIGRGTAWFDDIALEELE